MGVFFALKPAAQLSPAVTRSLFWLLPAPHSLRGEKSGLVTLIGTVAFIISVWDVDLIFVLLVNLVPIVFFSIYWKLRKSERNLPA